MSAKSKKLLDNPYIIMSMLLIFWGSLAGVSKLALTSVNTYQFLFYIYGSAFVITTPAVLMQGWKKLMCELTFRDLSKLIFISSFSFFYYFFYMKALEIIPAVEASMLNYLFPMFTVILSIPVNKEKFGKLKLIPVFLGFAGTIIILSNGNITAINMTNLKGDIYAITGAVLWGIFSNLGKKNSVNSTISNYIYTLTGFIFSVIFMFTFASFTIPGIKVMTGLVWIGLSNVVLTYVLWLKALKIGKVASIASITYITPFISLSFIILLTGEKITLYQFIGLVVIIAGIIISSAVNGEKAGTAYGQHH